MSQTAKIDIDTEIELRKTRVRNLQVKIDQEELSCREADVEAGRSRLISPAEFWDNVEKAGF